MTTRILTAGFCLFALLSSPAHAQTQTPPNPPAPLATAPLAPAPPAPATAGTERPEPQNRQEWTERLTSGINRMKRYPAGAYSDEEVRLTIRFVVRQDGTLASSQVETSSGDPLYDEGALKAVRRAAPFAAFTSDMNEAQLTFSLPFSFSSRQAPEPEPDQAE